MFTALATLAVGFWRAKRESDKEIERSEQWFRLSMSLLGTALITFLGAFGATGLASLRAGDAPVVALLTALFTAALVTAGALGALWKVSTLTKGISIMWPMIVEQKILEGGLVHTEPNPKSEDKK